MAFSLLIEQNKYEDEAVTVELCQPSNNSVG